MKYSGFYFWMFKGSMKQVLAKKYGRPVELSWQERSEERV